jgi:hypothetical protein
LFFVNVKYKLNKRLDDLKLAEGGNSNNDVNEILLEGYWLSSLLLMFAFQHFIFVFARIAIWMSMSVCCCGCPCMEDDIAPLPRDGIPIEQYDEVGN